MAPMPSYTSRLPAASKVTPAGRATAFMVMVSGSPFASLTKVAIEKLEATPCVNVTVGMVAQTGGAFGVGVGVGVGVGLGVGLGVGVGVGGTPATGDAVLESLLPPPHLAVASAAVVAVSVRRNARRLASNASMKNGLRMVTSVQPHEPGVCG